jgi:hypothetical protein
MWFVSVGSLSFFGKVEDPDSGSGSRCFLYLTPDYL